jgi:hypothetical protein
MLSMGFSMTYTIALVLWSHGASSVAEGEPSPLRSPSTLLDVENIAREDEAVGRYTTGAN